MSTTIEAPVNSRARGDEDALRILDRILAAAQPSGVFGPPVASGGYTVITASRVASAGGFGSGFGIGPSRGPTNGKNATADGVAPEEGTAGGGGLGGGGSASGRPVAIIVIGPDGVTVRPIVDVTSIVLAGIAASVAIATTLVRRPRMAVGSVIRR